MLLSSSFMITDVLFPKTEELRISSLGKSSSFAFPTYTDGVRDYGFYETLNSGIVLFRPNLVDYRKGKYETPATRIMTELFEYQSVIRIEDGNLVLERIHFTSQLSKTLEKIFNDGNTRRILDSTVRGVIPKRLITLDEVLEKVK